MPSMLDESVADPILLVTGPDGRTKEQFVGIVTLVGRFPDADVCLPDAEVDELHCLLTQTTAGLVAKDCFTRSGLFVNGERVSETLVSDGDELTIGPYRLRLRLPSSSGADFTVGAAQQELLHQMAKRVAALESKRKLALHRAWKYRRRGQRPPSTVQGGSPFGGAEKSRQKAVEAELLFERRRAAALEAELRGLRDLPAAAGGDAALLAEIQRLKEALAVRATNPDDPAMQSLRDYEQQLNEFRDQLSRDAEELQARELETSQRADEIRIAEEQLQSKISDTEKELAGERARVKREQVQLERMVAECRQDLEDMHREAETIERDEKYQRLRSQIRGHRDEKDSSDPPSVSERIQRFLKGLGG